MGKDWVKLYVCMLDDPKMGTMSDSQFRLAINTLLLAGEQDPTVQQGIDEWDGRLPSVMDICYKLNRDADIEHMESQLDELVERCWLSKDNEGYRVKHYWGWQRARTSTERVHAYRERVKETLLQQDGNVNETESYTDKIREDKKREDIVQPAQPIVDLIQKHWGIKDMEKYLTRSQYSLLNEAVDKHGLQAVEKWVRWTASKGMDAKRAIQATITSVNKYGGEDEGADQEFAYCTHCKAGVKPELVVDGLCNYCRGDYG